jgi:hypothetical protein
VKLSGSGCSYNSIVLLVGEYMRKYFAGIHKLGGIGIAPAYLKPFPWNSREHLHCFSIVEYDDA